MDELIYKYRDREVYPNDVEFINRLIADHPSLSRRALSAKLCEAWDWRQPNGVLKDMVCRTLMLWLHREGHITMPPPRHINPNPLANRKPPKKVNDLDCSEISISMKDIRTSGRLTIRQVRRTDSESLFNSLIETHHYIGFTLPVGEHLKYMVFLDDRPLACMAWCSAPRHIGARDRCIGWDQATRKKGIHLIAYNTRYLILPWVKVPHLASFLLGNIAKRISRDWQELYHHPIYFLETFIDPGRFKGTCYKAAGWTIMGETLGLGKDSRDGIQNRSIKEILGKPLCNDFRMKLMTAETAC